MKKTVQEVNRMEGFLIEYATWLRFKGIEANRNFKQI